MTSEVLRKGLIEVEPLALLDNFDQVVFRVVCEDVQGKLFCYGTAFPILPRMLITARHVLDELCRGAHVSPGKTSEVNITAINTGNDRANCIEWQIEKIYVPLLSDFALLQVIPRNELAENDGNWPVPALTLVPPRIGERVTAYGLTDMAILRHAKDHTINSTRISVSDKQIASEGVVEDVFLSKRDSARLNFPCFQLNARFDGGMSGGLVVGENGRVCGLVTSCMEMDGEYVSYATLLWPLMAQLVHFPMLAGIPLDKPVPLQTLGVLGIWQPPGWDRVDFEHDEGGRLLRAAFVTVPVVREGGFQIVE